MEVKKTDFQKYKAERNRSITQMFLDIKEKQPLASNNRIFEALSRDLGYSPLHIRNILVGSGVLSVKHQNNNK